MAVEKIELYDTTLRDGMQAEGVSFSLEDKLAITRCLDDLGVQYIEGGYAASNPKEVQFFSEAANLELKNSRITAFGSTRRAGRSASDDASLNAILACKTPVATLVGKCWDLHVTDVLGCSLDENIAMCGESVQFMKAHGLETIFDAEHFYDGYKQNPAYSMKVLAAAAEGGADVLALCDTNGGAVPNEVYEVTKAVCERFCPMAIGIHAHNDSDCATANSLAAVRAGARHVQGTMNGIGERCGNANLCTLIPPYVGESAFAHKAGLHVDALRKNKRTYEHIDPQLIGNERRFLISELSGKSNVLAELEKAKIAEDKKLARQIGSGT
jgi:2-isopropylmalate synthase